MVDGAARRGAGGGTANTEARTAGSSRSVGTAGSSTTLSVRSVEACKHTALHRDQIVYNCSTGFVSRALCIQAGFFYKRVCLPL